MIYYDFGPEVEAFSTNISDSVSFDAVTPAHQAHSINVAILPDEIDNTYGVDALITDRAGLRIGVRTADCVPVLVFDAGHKAIAAIHSGWKGSVNNIISAAIGRMSATYGSQPCDMRAVVGPCIHLEAFEVGDEVYAEFVNSGYGAFARRMRNPFDQSSVEKWHIDLPAVCQHQLYMCGVGQIEVRDECTYCCHDTLYSYRYSKLTGRNHRIYNCIMLKDKDGELPTPIN